MYYRETFMEDNCAEIKTKYENVEWIDKEYQDGNCLKNKH